MALAALSTFKGRIDKSDASEDAKLTNVLNGATRMVERYCNRRIEYAANQVELHAGGVCELHLRAWPVTAIASVKESATYDFAAAAALVENTDYRCVRSRGQLHRLGGGVWLAGMDTIQVTYSAGYLGPDATPVGGVETAPGHIQEAVLQQAADLWRRKDEPGYKIVAAMAAGLSSGFAPELKVIESVRELLRGERRIW